MAISIGYYALELGMPWESGPLTFDPGLQSDAARHCDPYRECRTRDRSKPIGNFTRDVKIIPDSSPDCSRAKNIFNISV